MEKTTAHANYFLGGICEVKNPLESAHLLLASILHLQEQYHLHMQDSCHLTQFQKYGKIKYWHEKHYANSVPSEMVSILIARIVPVDRFYLCRISEATLALGLQMQK